MPAAKTQRDVSTGSRFTEVFLNMERERSALGDTNDCTVKAISVVTGRPYKEVHEVMARHGRKARHGANWRVILGALNELGFQTKSRPMFDFISRYPGAHCGLRSVTSHHPERFPGVWRDGKAYIFDFGNHVAAVVNGTNHDWTKGRAKRIKNIFEVVPNKEQQS